jgi:hypothetical protein
MSKKKQRSPGRKQKQSDIVPIHGVSVQAPASITLSADSLQEVVKATTDRIMRDGRKRRDHAPKPEPSPAPTLAGNEEQWLKTAATIITNAWRAKIKMVDPDTNEPTEPMKRAYRHVAAIFDALKDMGVEHTDPVGRTYDSGMALKVVTFEPTPGLSKEEIKETIKPTVTWQGRLLQMGEVIVGTPQHA